MTTTRSNRALRLAHRGDWRRAPENSLAAMLAALEVPACDGLEFDVRTSRDGVPVLLHDETLARVQCRPERVRELDVEALARHQIPTLEAVLDAVPSRFFLDIELKGGHHGERAADLLRSRRGSSPARAVISSFEPATLAGIAILLPDWPRWLNVDDVEAGTVPLALELGCRGIAVEWRAITPAVVRAAHGEGLEVAAFTVRRRSTVARLERLGVAAICVEAAALDGQGPEPGTART
jgi:glycerophosphoryl diester phosphodiesterase